MCDVCLCLQVTSSQTGQQVYVLQYTASYRANPEVSDGFGAAAPILMTYIPLLALMALNVTTVWALRRHNLNTMHVQSSANEEVRRQRERQMTMTILATTVFYLVLSLPYAFHNLIKNSVPSYGKRRKYENLYYVVRSCAFTLTLLSCAIDFFCFLLLSSSFRKTLFRLLRLRPLFSKGGGGGRGGRGGGLQKGGLGGLGEGEGGGSSSFSRTVDSEVDTQY